MTIHYTLHYIHVYGYSKVDILHWVKTILMLFNITTVIAMEMNTSVLKISLSVNQAATIAL